ncbi:MAG: hypothetical protein WC528_00805 [Patescibacteria group bacterium]
MQLKDHQIDTLRLLAQYEETIGSLYQLYSHKFPAEKEFWEGLFKDESDHATWIKKFSGSIEEGQAYFQEKRFNIPAIESNINYVKEKYREAEKGNIPLIKAVALALDLEKSLLESKYYEVFNADLFEFKNLLQKLTDATKIHAQKVEVMLNKYRAKE